MTEIEPRGASQKHTRAPYEAFIHLKDPAFSMI
ncbi:Protein of unknown function [Pyronema omphalodes CBS 100304]|uniref:Uncharacterized protein n=1 Tax=Pyronema omphalodes (strain CBS 100304) TaxID=1076935 RepID=U4LHJ1_PYROM|nr:Protein of unknown function [Pyronema omphalodes CBS 100304]